MGRYRLIIDICEDTTRSGNSGMVTSKDLQEIYESVVSAAKVAVPERLKKSVRVGAVDQNGYPWHSHNGSDCGGCYRIADDGRREHDLSDVFPPIPVDTSRP